MNCEHVQCLPTYPLLLSVAVIESLKGGVRFMKLNATFQQLCTHVLQHVTCLSGKN